MDCSKQLSYGTLFLFLFSISTCPTGRSQEGDVDPKLKKFLLEIVTKNEKERRQVRNGLSARISYVRAMKYSDIGKVKTANLSYSLDYLIKGNNWALTEIKLGVEEPPTDVYVRNSSFHFMMKKRQSEHTLTRASRISPGDSNRTFVDLQPAKDFPFMLEASGMVSPTVNLLETLNSKDDEITSIERSNGNSIRVLMKHVGPSSTKVQQGSEIECLVDSEGRVTQGYIRYMEQLGQVVFTFTPSYGSLSNTLSGKLIPNKLVFTREILDLPDNEVFTYDFNSVVEKSIDPKVFTPGHYGISELALEAMAPELITKPSFFFNWGYTFWLIVAIACFVSVGLITWWQNRSQRRKRE
jgi:hypothetical protein